MSPSGSAYRIVAFLLLAALGSSFASVSASARPRNVILFIGDGMGFEHVTAASLYAHGEPGRLTYESWPVTLAVSTYPAGEDYNPRANWGDFDQHRHNWTDSAASATALSTGMKTANGVIGLDPAGHALEHLVDWFEDRGLATGLVSSVQFAHATPAGFCAHAASRERYHSIARQMLLESRVDVLMGCGHPEFDRNGRSLGEVKSYLFVGGEEVWTALTENAVDFDTNDDGRPDQRLADADGDGSPDPWRLIEARSEFLALADGPAPQRVLGVPRVAYTLQVERDGDRHAEPFEVPFLPDVPTLAEMTRAALNVLDDDPEGFFLMVEGGAIDWASHEHQTGRMLEEMDDFNAAVAAVTTWIEAESGWDETLVLITSDHECGYLCGPGSGPPVRWQPLENRGAGEMPGLSWESGTHTNSLVPLYARGAGSEVFVALARDRDPRRGPYLDNAAIAPALKNLWPHP